MSGYLAYAMLIYIIASLLYLIITRFIDTPLINSYTEEQKNIKKRSATKRGYIFLIGLVIATILIFVFQPFEKC